MKKILLLLFILMAAVNNLEAQSPAEQLAEKIAQKMKDTLLLTGTQKEQLYTINLQISDRKNEMRQQYSHSDSLRIKIQRVEFTRDSLYKPVLTEQQFNLYRQKKTRLVNNN